MEESQKSAVLLLHGQPGSPADWRYVAKLIKDSTNVLIPDRPGYGASPKPAMDFAGNAREMVALLDEQGIQQAVVAGYSWSGGVALQMALDYPDRVSGLVLVSSIGPGAVGVIDRFMARPQVSRLAAGLAVALSRPLDRLLEVRLRRSLRDMVKRDRQKRLATTFAYEQSVMVEQFPDLLARISEIKIPTVVVHGRRDWFVPSRVGRALSVSISGARLVELSTGNHYLPHHRPRKVADAIIFCLENS